MSVPRLVMIGWDAADRHAVETWMGEGALPNLQALRARGRWGRIAGLPGLGDDGAWGSFAIGTEPGSHGRFHHRQIVPGSYHLDNFFRERMTGEAFWSRVSDARRRVAVLDVPKSPLARNLAGIQLADWLPHGEDGPRPVSSPPAVAAALPERFRPPPGFTCHTARTTTAELAALRDGVRAHLDLRTELALDWLSRERWDLFLTVFAESHCIGHHCWHLHDPAHPAHDRDAARVLGDPVRETHDALDAALGRLLAACEPETTVVVFSLMGMGTNHMGSPALVDAVLRRLDASRGGGGVRERGRRILGRLRARRQPVGPDADVARRHAFTVHTNSVASAIRVNLVGREPAGKVVPEDYEDYCRFLTAGFEALVDAASGRRIVAEVLRVAERYPGRYAMEFADLLVVWRGDAPITAVTSDALGVVDAGSPPAPEPPGNHHPGGWFVAAGPGMAPGAVPHPVAIVDLAPTVGAILGVELAGLAGVPIVGARVTRGA
jgi:predicted AlkP superfamily phosphohydrolase/phosphomutase